MAELSRIETVVFLQTVDLFAHCRAEEVLRIAAIGRERPVAAGAAIYQRDDRADALFCVVRGRVRLDGDTRGERDVPPLGTFGALEILTGQLREADATAVEDSLLLAVEAEDFFDLLSNNIEIIRALFRHLTQEMRGC